MMRRFLVVPLLAPWVLVLLVAALNPRPSLSLRLLVWRSPALPIGTWLALASSGGALLTLSATAFSLQGHRPGPPSDPGARNDAGRGRWSRRRPASPRGGFGDDWQAADPGSDGQPTKAAAGPGRAPGEPAPTVSVPFRVIRRGAGAGGHESTSVAPTAHRRWAPFGSGSPQPSAAAAPGLDGWADPQDDDW